MDSRQRYYLDALGIQLYEWRDAAPDVAEEQVPGGGKAPEPCSVSPVPKESAPESVTTQTAAATTAQQSDDTVPAWLDEAPPIDEPLFDLDEVEVDESDFISAQEKPALPDVSTLGWEALQQRVAECSACPELVANRSQTVFGVGNKQADWLIIGEAPGADEDRQGEPFVGKAGQLLNAMLQALGLKREQVYIANVLKCRPPNNRDPKPEEAAACESFLKRQIALVQPKVILVVGRIAAQGLLNVDTPIGKLRGSVHRYEGHLPLVVTYHPAYLLRSPQEKRKAWADLCLARRVVEETA